jgi:hypothetical protein
MAQADLCFRYQKSGGGTLVARGATLPAPDTCQTFAFFEKKESPDDPGLAGAATGSICVEPEDETIAIFHYTYDGCMGPFSYFESATCRFQLRNDHSLPSIFGGCRGKVSGEDKLMHDFDDDSAILESCDFHVHLPPAVLCVTKATGFQHQLDRR